jgi:phage terminase large subunit-like protein
VAPRKKTLLDLVEDSTFVGRQDEALLASDDEPTLPWKSLEKIRDKYRAAVADRDDVARRRYRLEFEKQIPKMHERRTRAAKPADDALEKHGPIGSAKRLKAFFPNYLRWDDGTPFKLDPYQNLTIDLGWRRDKHGRRIFREIGEGISRGSGKTPFWSGIGTAALVDVPSRRRVRIFQTSGASEQAKLGLEYVGDWREEDERLRRLLRASSSRVERRDGRGSYSIIRASGVLGHGRRPNIGLVDEFQTIEHPLQEKTVTSLETKISHQADAFWAWIGTAGYSKDTMLGRAFDSALKLPHVERHNDGFHIRAWDEEAGRLFLWWGLPEGYELDYENDKEMLRVIRLCNVATFAPHDELLRAWKRALSKGPKEIGEFIRFNLNGWTLTEAGWLPAGCMQGLRVDTPLPKNSEIWVAVDAAKRKDTTAVVYAGRLPNGRIQLEGRVWAARHDAPAHVYVPGGRIDNRLAVDYIRNDLAKRFVIREIVADERYFDQQIWELGEDGFLASEFAQNSTAMRDAETHFYERATTPAKRGAPPPIAWYDPKGVFPQHVAAAAGVSTSTGWKVFNPDKKNPIDMLTAGMMARERCEIGTRKGSQPPMIGYA